MRSENLEKLRELTAQLVEAGEPPHKQDRESRLRDDINNVFLCVSDEDMYGKVLQIILEAMESPYGVFGYLDKEGDLICPSMTRNVWDQCQVPDKDIRFPRETWIDSSAVWAVAIREKRAITKNEDCNVPEGHIPMRRSSQVPILYRGNAIGLLEVGNKKTDYTHADEERLVMIARQIAPVLEARLRAQGERE